MPSRPSVRLSAVPAVAVVAALALLLTACVPESDPKPSHSASQPSEPSDSPTATVTPSPTPTAGTPAVPVSVACNTLVSPQTIYDFNPNFTLQANYSPASGTPANTAAADRGTACAWVNGTSGETVVVAVSRPGSLELASIRSAASAGTPVSGFGDAAYFSGDRFDAFRGNYWFVATSTYFGSADDASAIMTSALAGVG
jgi:hypothetical protein